MLLRSAEGVAREALGPRVPRDVAARHRQADQRDREGDGPVALDREHLPHAHPAQAQPHQQRRARALRGAPPARRLKRTRLTQVTELASAQRTVLAAPPAQEPVEAPPKAKILIVDDEPKSLFAL